MVARSRDSTRRSVSIKAQPKRRASNWPTSLLPVPMNPIRTTLRTPAVPPSKKQSPAEQSGPRICAARLPRDLHLANPGAIRLVRRVKIRDGVRAEFLQERIGEHVGDHGFADDAGRGHRAD